MDINKKNNPRWWEFYFVRYFVGTVLGIIIIFIINNDPSSALYKKLVPQVFQSSNRINTSYFFFLCGLGLAFCYIASGPILVLHATRASYLNYEKNIVKRIISPIIIVVIITIIILNIAILKLCLTQVSVLILFSIILIPQVIFLVCTLKNKGNLLFDYYKNLSLKRIESEKVNDYIESYRHLREHGNAFFILLFELILGLIFYFQPIPNLLFTAIILCLWIVPASLVWLVGTILEYRLINDNLFSK